MVPHSSGGRSIAILFLLAMLLLAPRPAYGGWSVDPVEVHSTTAECPQVAAAGDGAYGAVVVWQELTSGNAGVLKAQHLLSTGELDPAWTAPASVCANELARNALGAVADGLGGAYVWWLQGSSLLITRVAPNGAIASGWPAGGRVLGLQATPNSRPTFISDGAHGVYAAWLQTEYTVEAVVRFHVAHLGPNNVGAGGCPAGGRTIGYYEEQTEFVNTASIGLAPDGGVWAAWGTTVLDPDLGAQPGYWRLTRLLPSALAAPGWTLEGTAVGVFPGQALLDPYTQELLVPDMTLVGVATDGADGAYVVRGMPFETQPPGNPRVFRYGPDAQPATGWPAEGIYVDGYAFDAFPGMPNEASFRARSDGHGGVWAGRPSVYDHATNYVFRRFDATGSTSFGTSVGASLFQLEVASDGLGSVFLATCVPDGPYGYYSPYACVSAVGAPTGASFGEMHQEPVLHWYGDEGVVATEDGGAILAWSQARERFGIFAVRIGAAGLVTGVPPGVAVGPRLSLKYAPGVGVRARATFIAAGRAVCALHDVSGRTVASATVDVSPGVREWTIADTAGLPAGLYFANVRGAGETRAARVVVYR